MPIVLPPAERIVQIARADGNCYVHSLDRVGPRSPLTIAARSLCAVFLYVIKSSLAGQRLAVNRVDRNASHGRER